MYWCFCIVEVEGTDMPAETPSEGHVSSATSLKNHDVNTSERTVIHSRGGSFPPAVVNTIYSQEGQSVHVLPSLLG